MSKKVILFISFLFGGTFLAEMAKAICPICVVAVGAGLGLSRWLGVDDVVSSVWIGALLIAVSFWTLTEIKKTKWGVSFNIWEVSIFYYLLTLVPMYYAGIIGHPLNKIFGVDKIVFGIIVGTIIFLLARWLNLYFKKINNGKVFFLYQKVVIPVVILIITSLILYLLISYRLI